MTKLDDRRVSEQTRSTRSVAVTAPVVPPAEVVTGAALPVSPEPRTTAPNTPAPKPPWLTGIAGPAVAVLRIAVGFVFLWAFVDKLFGWHYSTGANGAWINGGSPTRGFLGHVAVGPLESMFNSMAGGAVWDWLFMLTLLGVGVAAISGVALRLAAVAGTVLMLLMWAAEWPLAQFTSAGDPSGSTNPLVDYHIVYAVALIVLAALSAGSYWGLGRWWAKLPIVQRWAWLR